MSIFSQRYRSRFGKKPARRQAGFTLIELLVVMAIMVIVSSVLLINQSKFDSSTLLRSLAYSVALSVRQAQVYGTSVFGTNTSAGTVFAPGYGIYVSSADTATYTLFADLNNNGTYDPPPAVEDVRGFKLGKGYAISNFCATEAVIQTNIDCWKGGTPTLTDLSIIFRRPNPEACFSTNRSVSICSPNPNPSDTLYSSASIQIKSAGGAASTRSIYINSTGQIWVGNSGT